MIKIRLTTECQPAATAYKPEDDDDDDD